MTILIHVLAMLTLSMPSVGASCGGLFDSGSGAAARAFTARAEQILDHQQPSAEDVRYIGKHVLTYPAIYLDALAEGHATPLMRLMSNHERAEVFFGANPANAMFTSDMLGFTDNQKPERYQYLIAPFTNIVTTPARELERRHPGFDGVRVQGETLVMLEWLGHSSEPLIRAAASFLDPSPWTWVPMRLKKWFSRHHDYHWNRAHVATNFLHHAAEHGEMPADVLERLIELAGQAKHPYKSEIWNALVLETLSDEQQRHLSDLWHRDIFSKVDRHMLSHRAKDLIDRLESLR